MQYRITDWLDLEANLDRPMGVGAESEDIGSSHCHLLGKMRGFLWGCQAALAFNFSSNRLTDGEVTMASVRLFTG